MEGDKEERSGYEREVESFFVLSLFLNNCFLRGYDYGYLFRF